MFTFLLSYIILISFSSSVFSTCASPDDGSLTEPLTNSPSRTGQPFDQGCFYLFFFFFFFPRLRGLNAVIVPDEIDSSFETCTLEANPFCCQKKVGGGGEENPQKRTQAHL